MGVEELRKSSMHAMETRTTGIADVLIFFREDPVQKVLLTIEAGKHLLLGTLETVIEVNENKPASPKDLGA